MKPFYAFCAAFNALCLGANIAMGGFVALAAAWSAGAVAVCLFFGWNEGRKA